MEVRAARGLLAAGRLVETRSRKNTPVDTGALRDSHYVREAGSPGAPAVEIGCTAPYAPFVHEDLDAWHAAGRAKFLEAALKDSLWEIAGILAAAARLP